MICNLGCMVDWDRCSAVLQRCDNPANGMRLLSAIAFLALVAAPAGASAAPLPSPDQVDIPSGSGILHAQLYKPAGGGPFPVVIGLHGCGGLGGHSEPGLPRYCDWAEQPAKQGTAGLR